MTEEIDAPLGRPKRRNPLAGMSAVRLPSLRISRPRTWPIARILFALSALILSLAYVRVAFYDDPLGGRPSAIVDISSSRNSNAVANEVASTPPSPPQAAIESATATDGQTTGTGPQITAVDPSLPDSEPMPIGIRALTEFGVDPDLIEETPNGPIPQIGGAGKTPFGTYARASIGPASADGKAMIAIVVTGLGLNESGTLDAIAKLPDNVTLAFAPYGRSLTRTTAAARAEGHEMLLQIPMEPFDYPDNDPGPQTLLTGQTPRANLDKLYWLMARFGGYFGVMNYMGARFSAAAADFEPIIEEIGTRGLGYIDDGTSNRSVAPQLAERNQVPFARGFGEIDATPSRAAILAKLSELEIRAAENGMAVGIASALPISIDAITDWAEGLQSRGAVLVPVSAIMK
ncbi:MAG: divergent polysaccharide deacetylase family protein [Alphaproteobacteria bacterium]|nr:divergent polysaccharide deacetylase family protein [Alphaproteobacteria bacterium]